MKNKFTPHIFIGSSSESKAIAEQVQDELSGIADCTIWNRAFDLGNSAYEDLVNKLSLYDYGILIASADDLSKSRGMTKPSMRDNVLFEFGLFVGRLGRYRAFLLAEEGVKIPSDLNGITLPFFKSAKATRRILGIRWKTTLSDHIKHRESVENNCQQIISHIESRANVFEYGFLPSTALAYGYFNNFVLKAITNLLDSGSFQIDGNPNSLSFEDVSFTVFIPNDLRSDMFDKVRQAKSTSNWRQVKITAGIFRPFDFFIHNEDQQDRVLRLSDIPITLNALNDAIQAYLGKKHLGDSESELLLESRELRVFKGVLDYLIKSNPTTKSRVKTEIVDI
jgi:hypothetical protein